MPRIRKQLPVFLGKGHLRYRGFEGVIDYEILGEPSSLRLGPLRLRGSLIATPEIAEDAFRAGEAVLILEDNEKPFRVTMLGYTTGSNVAYFEMRI